MVGRRVVHKKFILFGKRQIFIKIIKKPGWQGYPSRLALEFEISRKIRNQQIIIALEFRGT